MTSYYHLNDFSAVEKIDMHIHLNAKTEGLISLGNRFNFKLIVVNTDIPYFPSIDDQAEVARSIMKKFPGRLEYLTTFSLEGWDSDDWAGRTVEKLKYDLAGGASGVKIWKNIGMDNKDKYGNFIMIDDPKFKPVMDYLVRENIPVLGHLGEPRNCWLPVEDMTVNNDKVYFSNHPEYHMYLHPEYPSYEDHINTRDRFLRLYPGLRFTGAHFGSLEWSVDEIAKRLDEFPGMMVDTASRLSHMQVQTQKDPEKVRQFFIRYQDRIVYGTDFIEEGTPDEETVKPWENTWLSEWKYLVTDEIMTHERVNGEFTGIRLPREVIDKIYFKNTMHWLSS